MELPKMRKPVATNPHVMIIYSMPKAGKTTICAQLPNSCVLELEPGGADYVEGVIIDIDKSSKLDEAIKAIKDAGKPYDYIIVDTITKLDEWSEIVGTYNYMAKPQGKKFNRLLDSNGNVRKDAAGNPLTIYHTDKRFETVHEIGEGFGYQHSRNQMVKWYDELSTLAPHVIFIAHIKDKMVTTKTGGTAEAIDLNLTGKVKFIYSTRVDAVAFFTRRGTTGTLSFGNEFNVISGGRCSHLNGDIVISEKQEDGTIKTFWDRIFLK